MPANFAASHKCATNPTADRTMRNPESARIIFRHWQEGDAAFLFRLNRDPEVTRFTDDVVFDTTDEAGLYLEENNYFQNNDCSRWLLQLKSNGELAGWCGLKHTQHQRHIAELGFRISKLYRGFGYATEAAAGLLKFGFVDLKLTAIIARVAIDNTASQRVIEKLGMHFEKEEECGHHPAKLYGLSKQQWIASMPLLPSFAGFSKFTQA